jgi:hypothetical protein
MRSKVHEALVDLQYDAADLEERFDKLHKNEDMLEKILEKFPDSTVSKWGYISIKLEVEAFLASVADNLVDAIEWLTEISCVDPTSTDLPGASLRIYNFDCNGIEIKLYAKTVDNSLCYRRVVGHKTVEKAAYVTVEEPVYEFVC